MAESTCNNCRKWLSYPQTKDSNLGVCIEPNNGFCGKFRGGLANVIGECRNYAPMTCHYLGCEYFESKETK